MAKYRYAQIRGGVVVGILDTDGVVVAPGMVEVADKADVMGKTLVNGAFVDDALELQKATIRAQLAAIDAATGMGPLLRQTLIAIAGGKAPAELSKAESDAAKLRADLAAL